MRSRIHSDVDYKIFAKKTKLMPKKLQLLNLQKLGPLTSIVDKILGNPTIFLDKDENMPMEKIESFRLLDEDGKLSLIAKRKRREQ